MPPMLFPSFPPCCCSPQEVKAHAELQLHCHAIELGRAHCSCVCNCTDMDFAKLIAEQDIALLPWEIGIILPLLLQTRVTNGRVTAHNHFRARNRQQVSMTELEHAPPRLCPLESANTFQARNKSLRPSFLPSASALTPSASSG